MTVVPPAAAPGQAAGTATPAGEWWRGLRPWARWALAAVAAAVGLNVALAGLAAVTGGSGPGGPPSSSYATSGSGLAAFAQFVADEGHPVRRLRTSLDRAHLDPGGTLVMADVAAVTPAEADALARFVGAGGRLVTAGDGAADLVGVFSGDGPSASPASATAAHPLVAVPEVAGVERVVSEGLGSFDRAGATLPVLAGHRATLVTVATVGRGRVVALADATPLHNRLLARADNAAFALAAVGKPGRPVAFAEAQHGYGPAKGLAAIPGEWRWALGMGLFAVLVAMWAKGRRLGPAEELERVLPPPRRAYVDAMASTLARAKQPSEAMAPLQAAARRRLARRAGLPADAGDDELRRAAARAGLADADAAALLAPVVSDRDVVAAARALARLEGAER